MEFKAIVDVKARDAADCAIIGIYEQGDLGQGARAIDEHMGGLLVKLHASGDFAGKLGDVLLLPVAPGAAASRVLLIGLGARSAFGRKPYRKAVHASAQALGKTGAATATVYLALEEVADLDVGYRARIVAEVFRVHAYKVPDLKTGARAKAAPLASVSVATENAKAARAAAAGLLIGEAVGSGIALARDLGNLPPNVCTPTYLGSRALQLAKEWPSIKAKAIDAAGIEALKMGAFLAVTQGSEQPPRLIVCEYRGANKGVAPVCLVGKGITFDSGGISLKDPPAMDEMKFDMSGAATVLGALRAVAELELPINLVVIVAACENMPSGAAVKPADIVTTM
jgi:leucyl aminopeptidase